MARRSILSSVREEQSVSRGTTEVAQETGRQRSTTVKPSRRAKLHIGGYYSPDDPSIIAFQKLGIDLRKSQQEMLFEALRDFVAKHEAARAFG
jgi:hypothetical protein